MSYILILAADDVENAEILKDEAGNNRVFGDYHDAELWVEENLVTAWHVAIFKEI